MRFGDYGRDIVESYDALTPYALRRTGILAEDAPYEEKREWLLYGPVGWPRHWEHGGGSVFVELHGRDADTRTVKITWTDDSDREWINLITLFPQPCHLGGVRWWLSCPYARPNAQGVRTACERRCSALYFKHGRFGCRQCHRLTYRTCQRGKNEREWGILAGTGRRVDKLTG